MWTEHLCPEGVFFPSTSVYRSTLMCRQANWISVLLITSTFTGRFVGGFSSPVKRRLPPIRLQRRGLKREPPRANHSLLTLPTHLSVVLAVSRPFERRSVESASYGVHISGRLSKKKKCLINPSPEPRELRAPAVRANRARNRWKATGEAVFRVSTFDGLLTGCRTQYLNKR